jgi:hypothetical protein
VTVERVPSSEAATFVKSINLSDGGLVYRIEREKARCMTEAFAPEADLHTPALLDADDSRGLLTFEHMPPIRSFSPSTAEVWFARAGRALALVHSRMTLPDDLILTRKRDRELEGLVLLHGDFMPNNLGIAEDQLVVFDWGPRPWSTEVYTRATPSLDLASFLGPWMHPRWWDPRTPVRKFRIMIDEYLLGVGRDSPTGELARETIGEELTAQFRHRIGGLRQVSLFKRLLHGTKLRLNHLILTRSIASYYRRR